jgi:threonine dehydratase
MTALDPDLRSRGVVAATRGNHGLGVSWAARAFGVPATICVPIGNNPEKNAAMRALGAEVIEEGVDYDVAIGVAERVQRETGATMAHSTNDRDVIAGAATMTLEILEQASSLDALVLVVGGGSQAVGALTVTRALAPHVQVFAVQAEGARATHDAWHTGEMRVAERADTFADGMATRSPYALTFPALRAGLAGFVTVSDAEIAEAMRLLLRTTHTLVEGAGAGGLAGLLRLRASLAGRAVGIVISGGNVDAETLRRVMTNEL